MTEDSMHWADQIARQVINERGDKEQYVVAAGITPSGTIHIGNFREIITNDLVARALVSQGKKVRYIYSWDNYDVYRKVPKNMPKQEELQKCLRKPIIQTIDPFGCHESYAHHNQEPIEKTSPLVGINPEYIYQDEKYRAGEYTEDVKFCLEHIETIRKVLDKYRKEPLVEDWLPITMFCEECGKDTLTISWQGGYDVSYKCECGKEESFDYKKKPLIKLKWRIDWPMRQHYEQVDFEPAGKEHYALPGGSRITANDLYGELYNEPHPIDLKYDFITIKGQGGKMSSSLGNVISLMDTLEIYEPQIIRHLFAGTRPNTEFAISFDLDVFKVYEDYDKCERIYFKTEEAAEKDFQKQKRIYELSQVDKPPKEIPFQASMRHLMNVVQQYQGDMGKIKGFYKKEIKTKEDEKKVETRAICALNWLEKYAPEDFKFKVNTIEDVKTLEFTAEEKTILKALAESLNTAKSDEKTLHDSFYVTAEQAQAKPQDLFKAAYKLLISKERGPRLANFILTIGIKEVIELVDSIK
ncbi:MAG: lysine--tRNA ligase [Nanoarchaeota archaeon]|nr:lysine--tRNA ligase [Nanoarchaeota archaeon]